MRFIVAATTPISSVSFKRIRSSRSPAASLRQLSPISRRGRVTARVKKNPSPSATATLMLVPASTRPRNAVSRSSILASGAPSRT